MYVKIKVRNKTQLKRKCKDMCCKVLREREQWEENWTLLSA